ncbi:hypothetical protein U3A55_11980 [Salarchaeum sp. III]|uniref:hypothetical protein n=1 Tax=Salarchaeum sp. III TaxID=3107927 RepID=UPI002ED941C5
MVSVNGAVADIGDTVRHKGHKTAEIANVPDEEVDDHDIPADNIGYEPAYAGEVVDRVYRDGSVFIKIEIFSTEDSDFFEVGDRPSIQDSIIREKDWYVVE